MCSKCLNQWNLPVFGHWLPPKRWKSRLYGFFWLRAPDRWIKCCTPREGS
jgi:hypothetical protein